MGAEELTAEDFDPTEEWRFATRLGTRILAFARRLEPLWETTIVRRRRTDPFRRPVPFLIRRLVLTLLSFITLGG